MKTSEDAALIRGFRTVVFSSRPGGKQFYKENRTEMHLGSNCEEFATVAKCQVAFVSSPRSLSWTGFVGLRSSDASQPARCSIGPGSGHDYIGPAHSSHLRNLTPGYFGHSDVHRPRPKELQGPNPDPSPRTEPVCPSLARVDVFGPGTHFIMKCAVVRTYRLGRTLHRYSRETEQEVRAVGGAGLHWSVHSG
ncbi:hypothetical protein DPEC_G00287470 [Dallia pectoralis]|uniref:Uncharacterized protein n=1 Tax=Dallia pectoralis TaxID=75939 RepID=A0ACC2FKI1_DALPE|nr:hypothetical protein DPEC_G00287470 [Dallia pectoralis]